MITILNSQGPCEEYGGSIDKVLDEWGSGASVYKLMKHNCAHLFPTPIQWQLKISESRSIYTTEISKYHKHPYCSRELAVNHLPAHTDLNL